MPGREQLTLFASRCGRRAGGRNDVRSRPRPRRRADAAGAATSRWPNLAESLEKAKSLGRQRREGHRRKCRMGKFAFIADPTGGIIGLWEFGGGTCD